MVAIRLYLAGRMQGQPNWGFPVFDDARDQLTAQGFVVISPADLDRQAGWVYEVDGRVSLTDGFELEMAMSRNLAALAACDGIVLLPGWETSDGAANQELPEARRLGKRVYWYEAGLIEELRESGATLNGPERPAAVPRPKAAPKLAGDGSGQRGLPERAQNELLYPNRCRSLIVTFLVGVERTYPIHQGGDWAYRENPSRIVVRPRGRNGARHEIPLLNVASVMLATSNQGAEL